MEEDKGVTITYETLYEILRREKDRVELQNIEPSFFDDVIIYLKEKQAILEGKEDQQELFNQEEKIKTEKQLTNVKKILREFYEKREKKIINMALDKSRTKSDLIDTSALIDPEKSLFESLVRTLDSYRENVLLKILDMQAPSKVEEKEFKEAIELTQDKPTEEKSTKLLRFKHAVPKFVGLEGEEFGPFEEEDIASLPKEIAEVLINKDRVEEIKQD